MPAYTNDCPVTLDVRGQMVPPGANVTCPKSDPAVVAGHLIPAPKNDTEES